MALSEQQRKDKLTEMTGGLKCRCPGFEKMVHVECKGIDGIKYCKFACENSEGQWTEYPVGDSGLCACKLGTTIDPITARTVTQDGAEWGYATCNEAVEGQGLKPEVVNRNQSVPVWLPWVAVAGFAGLVWYVTKD